MNIESIVVTVLLLSFIGYRTWKMRKVIKQMYVAGFSSVYDKLLLTQHISLKEQKSVDRILKEAG